MIPPVRACSFDGTHRLIPSKFSPEGTVLAQLAKDSQGVQDLIELDGATNARLIGEEGLLPGISVHELVYGVPYGEIVNASFTHAAPVGSRFSSSRRGAWYAGLDRETSVAEVAFHKLEQLREVNWKDEEVSTCDDYMADLIAEFHDLRGSSPRFRKYLKPEPIPECYQDSQQLADDLLARGSNGVVYPSVRHKSGICVVCFRPALVYHVRFAARLEFSLQLGRSFATDQVREIKLRGRR